MTIATLTMPRLGETMEQGEIVGWLVEVGQGFKRGDAILEVETDKTVVEYPALGDGVLAEILAQVGDSVPVGDAIARIDLGDGPDWTGADQAGADTAQTPVAAQAPGDVAQPRQSGDRLRATPVARRIARQGGVDLEAITGTGRRGRIEAGDVERAIEDGQGGAVRLSHDIAYVTNGPVGGTPYLLIHGFAGDHTTFAVLSAGLKRAGCRVVACDLPGHGATRLGASGVGDLSTNLAAFARAQFGTQPFHLVAHSMGALPAFEIARSGRLASLTLIAPVGLGQAGNPDFLRELARPDSVESVRNQLGLLTETPNGLSDAAIAAVYDELSKGRLVDLADAMGAQVIDNLEILQQLAPKIPTRVLIGERDRILAPVDPYALPPEVAWHGFRQTGHTPHWENPRAVLNILLA